MSKRIETDGSDVLQAISPFLTRRHAIVGLSACLTLATGAAQAQTDGEATRILRELAPQDRAPAGAAPRRRPVARRQLKLRGNSGSVIVDTNRRVDVTVFFDLNSSDLRPDAQITLERMARVLNHPILLDQNFLIAGHTSADGDYDFNVALSHDRANSVRSWLIAYGGVSASRLLANGFGPDLLRSPRNPASSINRRVEIIAVTA